MEIDVSYELEPVLAIQVLVTLWMKEEVYL